MQIFYIVSQSIEDIKKGSVIQILYTSREFQRKIKGDFTLIANRVKDTATMHREAISYKESGGFSRARILYYIIWLPIFFIKQERLDKNRIIYCRDWHVALSALLYRRIFGYKIAVEYHDPPYGFWGKRDLWKDILIVRFCDYLLPTTHAMGAYLKRIHPSAGTKMYVVPNGIDIKRFTSIPSKNECRKMLGLPHDKKIVLYSGNFGERKGSYVLADVISHIKHDIFLVFVGGTDNEVINKLRRVTKSKRNILIIGYRPHEEIPYWLYAADVLVAPHSADASTVQGEASILWMSPMKVFEYMAARRAIVASDTPATREILNEKSAILVKPDNPRALALGITEALDDQAGSERRASQAFSDVQQYAWNKRANKILNFISA